MCLAQNEYARLQLVERNDFASVYSPTLYIRTMSGGFDYPLVLFHHLDRFSDVVNLGATCRGWRLAMQTFLEREGGAALFARRVFWETLFALAYNAPPDRNVENFTVTVRGVLYSIRPELWEEILKAGGVHPNVCVTWNEVRIAHDCSVANHPDYKYTSCRKTHGVATIDAFNRLGRELGVDAFDHRYEGRSIFATTDAGRRAVIDILVRLLSSKELYVFNSFHRWELDKPQRYPASHHFHVETTTTKKNTDTDMNFTAGTPAAFRALRESFDFSTPHSRLLEKYLPEPTTPPPVQYTKILKRKRATDKDRDNWMKEDFVVSLTNKLKRLAKQPAKVHSMSWEVLRDAEKLLQLTEMDGSDVPDRRFDSSSDDSDYSSSGNWD
jgi:hypothetical protein